MTLADFRGTVGTLTPAQRATVVRQAMAMIDGLYVHLPLKRAMHATDPVQRLRLLAQRLPALSERQFHDELIDIFTDLRDLHTNYVLPAPFADKTAVLPFLVEEYVEKGKVRYLVTKVAQGVTAPGFVPGVTVTSWNGIAFDRAVELNADRQAGSNDDARRARGLEAMTIRWLGMSPPPDEDWVVVGYTDSAGQEQEFRFQWLVLGPDPAPNGVDPSDSRSAAARNLGIDGRFEAVRRAKKRLFNPDAVALEVASRPSRKGGVRAKPAAADASTMPDVFSFRPVDGPGGPYGYLRIWTFSVDDDGPFLDEFTRIAGAPPPEGAHPRRAGQRRRPHHRGREPAAAADAADRRAQPPVVPEHAADARPVPALRLRLAVGAVDRPLGGDRRAVLPGPPPRRSRRGQPARPALPGPRRARHRRALLQRHRHLHRRVPGQPDRPGARRQRQHRRRRGQRVGPRAAAAAVPGAQQPVRRAAEGHVVPGRHPAGDAGRGPAPGRRSRTSASCPTSATP